MPTRKELRQLLQTAAFAAGYEDNSDAAIIALTKSKIILNRQGKPLWSTQTKLSPIDCVIDELVTQQPLYLSGKNGELIRISWKRKEKEGQILEVKEKYKPINPPPLPTFWSKFWDGILRRFGSSNPVCDRWNDYVAESRTRQEVNDVYQVVEKKARERVEAKRKQTSTTLEEDYDRVIELDSRKEVDSREKEHVIPLKEDSREKENVIPLKEESREKEHVIPLKEESREERYDRLMKVAPTLPEELLVCDKIETLKEALTSDELTPQEKALLEFRMETAEKIATLASDPMKPDCPVPKIDGINVSLPTVRQPQKQSTKNGCWSVSMQSLMAYHGVNLTQQAIRAFRPDCSLDTSLAVDEISQRKERTLLCNRMNSDAVNEIADFSDLIHTTISDVALHHVSVNVSQGADELEKYIRMGLAEHNSPICMCHKTHYRTIVGIEGEEVLLLDPNRSYPEVDGKITPQRISLKELAQSKSEVSLDWLEKVQPLQKEIIVQSLEKAEDFSKLFSRRQGFTVNTLDGNASSSHDIIYPKSYKTQQAQKLADSPERAQPTEEKKNNAKPQRVEDLAAMKRLITEKSVSTEANTSRPKRESLTQEPKEHAQSKNQGGRSR